MKQHYNTSGLDELFGFDAEPIEGEMEFHCEHHRNAGGILTEDMKKQISRTMTGRKRGPYKPRKKGLSEETKQKHRENALKNNIISRLNTPEAIKKMAETKRKTDKNRKRNSKGQYV